MSNPIELWAGPECTVNRVGDQYYDQMAMTGHDRRIEDIDRLAALGASAVRYPVLWEKVAPNGLASADWSWTDERLERLIGLGVNPIAGLLHHGSGPADLDLLHPDFVPRFAEYAEAVANRYPWLTDYTPVNEPLTTARFSCLYGRWYPHRSDDESFVRALLNECRATVAAMAAIRRVNPHARLVQTEDFGYTRSRPGLEYQAQHENERRWLSLDLLTGAVRPSHPLWRWLLASGATRAELHEFADSPCPPDVIGLNYYVTSERYLDERLELYPEWAAGGNEHDQYADVEAVRVPGQIVTGHAGLLRQAWERYERPLALTEVHLGSSREEQLRWLLEAWDAVRLAHNEGIDVRALTVWAAFGSCDWDSLVTELRGHYEPGLFDARSDPPRPTALARAFEALASGQSFDHPALEGVPWWRSEGRYQYGIAEEAGRE